MNRLYQHSRRSNNNMKVKDLEEYIILYSSINEAYSDLSRYLQHELDNISDHRTSGFNSNTYECEYNYLDQIIKLAKSFKPQKFDTCGDGNGNNIYTARYKDGTKLQIHPYKKQNFIRLHLKPVWIY